MAIYRYSQDSIIDEVEIVTTAQGGSRAYLHARADASPEQVSHVRAAVAAKGWAGIPYTLEGRNTLEVRGFDKPEEVTRFLTSGGYSQGAAAVQQTDKDKQSFADKFRSASLKWTGLAYIAGDAAFMTYAQMEHNKNKKDMVTSKALWDEAKRAPVPDAKLIQKHRVSFESAHESASGGNFKKLAGIGYAIGSLILMGFGSRDQSRLEIKNAIDKVDRFARTEGIRAAKGETLFTQEPEEKKPSLWSRANDLLRRYPSEALNIVYTGVGLLLMRSSISAFKAKPKSFELTKWDTTKRKLEEGLDIGLGLVTATSAIAGLTIKEKKPLEGDEKRKGWGGFWDWIQEKPLRATGYGYMIATGIHGIVTASKVKWKPKDASDHAHNKVMLGRAIFVGLNIVAEALMVISSKGHGEGVKSPDVDNTVIAAAAEFIAKQDPALRERLVERLAGYMASPDVLAGKAEDIAIKLRSQLSTIDHNPWNTTKPTLNTPQTQITHASAQRLQSPVASVHV